MEEQNKIAYCVKCKQKREIANPVEATLRNGRKALRGLCSVCGTPILRFLPNKSKEEDA